MFRGAPAPLKPRHKATNGGDGTKNDFGKMVASSASFSSLSHVSLCMFMCDDQML